MAINRIKVSNFKTFKELDLELGSFNVVIGANASGKSNFTDIFRFLRDIEREDTLTDAVSMNGGIESLRNLKVGCDADLSIEAESDKQIGWGLGDWGFRTYLYNYSFSLSFPRAQNGFKITKDELLRAFGIVPLKDKDKEKQKALFEEETTVSQGKMTIRNVDQKPKFFFEPDDIVERLETTKLLPLLAYSERFPDARIPPNTLLVQMPWAVLPPWETLFRDIGIYDIDPHLARNPVQITGKAELEEDGKNLALVLNKLIEDTEQKRKFCNLMKDLLPFFDDIGTERFAERSLLMRLREDYYEDDYLRAYMLSDGTINVTALLIVLYFERKDVIIVEEPERNIHPRLISGILDMMKDASKNKQIIVTTHSPEVVKHAGLENLLLVSRDKDGFSTVSRPSERQQVKVFMDNELGLDELFIDNLLGD